MPRIWVYPPLPIFQPNTGCTAPCLFMPVGWGVLKAMSKARIHLKGDERILGDSDFVKKVLSEQKEQFERRYWLKAQGYDIDRVVEKVAKVFGVEP